MHLTRRIHDNSLTNISSLWHWFQRTELTLAGVLLPAVLLQQWRSTLQYSRTVEKNNLQKYNITKGKHWSASLELEFIYFLPLLYLFRHFPGHFTINEENLSVLEIIEKFSGRKYQFSDPTLTKQYFYSLKQTQWKNRLILYIHTNSLDKYYFISTALIPNRRILPHRLVVFILWLLNIIIKVLWTQMTLLKEEN